MATKNPRLNVVLDPDLYSEIQKLAQNHGISLSLMARDLLKEAIERHEDSYWQKTAEERDKALKDKDVEKKFYWANRSIAIIVELITVLDSKQGGDMSMYLMGLYNYQIQSLSEATAYNKIEKIDEVSNVFKGLLEAWRDTTHVAN